MAAVYAALVRGYAVGCGLGVFLAQNAIGEVSWRGQHGWHAHRLDHGMGICLPPLMVLETHAIHIQRKLPPQDTQGQISGDELAGIRCGCAIRSILITNSVGFFERVTPAQQYAITALPACYI
jgi:hypothetical protein